MKLVIEIPKYVYDTIVASGGYVADCDNEKVGMAVKNGTPLPEGHGRLIDADTMWDNYHSNDYDFYEALDETPTIIPAMEEIMYYPQVDGITPSVITKKEGDGE